MALRVLDACVYPFFKAHSKAALITFALSPPHLAGGRRLSLPRPQGVLYRVREASGAKPIA